MDTTLFLIGSALSLAGFALAGAGAWQLWRLPPERYAMPKMEKPLWIGTVPTTTPRLVKDQQGPLKLTFAGVAVQALGTVLVTAAGLIA